MEYYLLCSYPLSPGSIIEPGNWGRMLNLYTPNQNLAGAYREQIYEKIRMASFPDKPSRLECIFLCETLEEATSFRNETQRIFDIIYKVKLVDSSATIFRTDWKNIGFNPPENTHSLEIKAREYWGHSGSDDIQHVEILTLSKVETIESLG